MVVLTIRMRMSRVSMQPFYRRTGVGGAGRGQAEGGAAGTRPQHRRRIVARSSGIASCVARASWVPGLLRGEGRCAVGGWSGGGSWRLAVGDHWQRRGDATLPWSGEGGGRREYEERERREITRVNSVWLQFFSSFCMETRKSLDMKVVENSLIYNFCFRQKFIRVMIYKLF
jgi:hypothetical protein